MVWYQVSAAVIAIVFWVVVVLTKQVDELGFGLAICAVPCSVMGACGVLLLVVVPLIISVNFVVAWMNDDYFIVP